MHPLTLQRPEWNPVKRGHVELREHLLYSNTQNYPGQPGLIRIHPPGAEQNRALEFPGCFPTLERGNDIESSGFVSPGSPNAIRHGWNANGSISPSEIEEGFTRQAGEILHQAGTQDLAMTG